jgi:hypothetical protein
MFAKTLFARRQAASHEDSVLRRCREIYNSLETDIGSYPGDQKDYDKSWITRLEKIMQYIEEGDRDIQEILARLRQYWMRKRWQVGEFVDYCTDGKIAPLLARSAYVYYRQAVAEAVSELSRKETKAVIDLGSGNGEQIMWIWNEARLRGRRFYACEFSEAGRRTTRLLASLDPRIKIETRFLDYRNPDLSGLKRRDGHVLVYSTHSIEQVSEVSPALIGQLCDLAPEVTGVHFEPIGWQFASNPDEPFIKAHRERCAEHNYNTNFWSLLKDNEKRGLIRIDVAEPYYMGFAYNPVCKVVWTKTRAGT